MPYSQTFRTSSAQRRATVPARIVFLSCLVVAYAAGCGENGSLIRPPDYTRYDSANVTIIDNHLVDSRFLQIWSVDTTASLSIGSADGDTAQRFNEVKGVRQLPNGMIVVLNGQGSNAFELRFFGENGSHIAKHGASGDAPGEFRRITFMAPAGGDTVLVLDAATRRVSWVTASSGFVRSEDVDASLVRRAVGNDAAAALATFAPLGGSAFGYRMQTSTQNSENPRQRTTSFHVVDGSTGAIRQIASHDEAATKEFAFSRGPAYMHTEVESARASHAVHAGATGVFGQGRLCVALSTKAQITCVDKDDKRVVIRWQPDSLTYSDADRKNHEDRLRAALDKSSVVSPADRDMLVAAQVYPSHFNVLNLFDVDADGNFWVHEGAVTRSGQRHSRFRVFNADGQHIAYADAFDISGLGNLAQGGATSFIGSNAVFRRTTDASGAQRVQMFRIHKPR